MNEENLPKDTDNIPEETENSTPKPEVSERDIEDIEKEWAEELHFDSWPPKPSSETSGDSQFSQTPPPFTGDENKQSAVPPATPTPPPYQEPTTYIASNAIHSSGSQDSAYTEPMPNTYLVWSVLATVMCCLIPGIVAIIYSSKVTSRYYAKDYEGAKRASELAQYWIIGSIVVGIVVQTLYIPLMMAM